MATTLCKEIASGSSDCHNNDLCNKYYNNFVYHFVSTAEAGGRGRSPYQKMV